MNPRFSIIIPTYNRADLLTIAVDSVLQQTAANWELIVVDDGSTDSTAEVVRGYADDRIRYVRQANGGQSAARNHGVRHAGGEFVLFLDDDDRYLPHHLSLFEQAIAEGRDPRPTIYRSGFLRIENGQSIRTTNYAATEHNNPVRYATYHMCGLWTLCIPRQYLMDNHSPVGFPHWQDTHLILRLLAQFPFRQLDAYSYAYNFHDRMGSVRSTDPETLYRRAQINVAAMEDCFQRYGHLIGPFLPDSTLDYLRAEKYIQYANFELLFGARKYHFELLRRSLRARIDLRLWRNYAVFLRELLRGKR